MAPAVLATLNEPSFQGQCGAVFMRKFTNQSVTENINNPPLPLFNPNPNFNSSKQYDDSSEFGSYATFNVAGYTPSQVRELKKRFASELEQIRILRERIESGTFETQKKRDYTIPEVSAVRSAPTNSFAGETNDLGPKKKKQKKNVSRCNRIATAVVSDPESEKLIAGMLKTTCNQILVKLMKHKWAWVFNTPVDVVGLGLHDYHLIVKKPMDLGTVKLNLEKRFYSSPIDFATDVRLTFNNAMAYNPKGQDVYFMAGKLLDHFDGMFNPAFKKFEAQLVKLTGSSSSSRLVEPELKPRQWNQNQSPMVPIANPRKGTEQISIAKKLDSVKPPPPPQQPTLPPQLVEPPRVQSPSPPPPPPPPPPVVKPQSPPPPLEVETAPPDVSEVIKARKGKLPKPKAKDPNKRQMTMEEKSKLGMNLQDLPPEKLGQLVQILRKRNGHLAQDGDEIELDIEAVDNETLWELDRFVTNYKKMASKIKRQGFIRNVSTPPRNMAWVTEMGSAEKRIRKGGDAGEEDIDIGEDIPIEDYPSVEIERDGTALPAAAGGVSSGSSSSGSSSSSSGSSSSDSGSGGDSDADSVQSPFA